MHLQDPNQLIRASALRVLSSIRVSMIVPIMMLAIKESVTDMSPYVRKTAAHAIPKLYRCLLFHCVFGCILLLLLACWLQYLNKLTYLLNLSYSRLGSSYRTVVATIFTSAVRIVFFFHYELNRIE